MIQLELTLAKIVDFGQGEGAGYAPD